MEQTIPEIRGVSWRKISEGEVNNMLTLTAASEFKGILGGCDEQLVSCDFNHDPRSAIVGLPQTRVWGKRLIKIQVWFDNGWGGNRMLDTTIAAMEAP